MKTSFLILTAFLILGLDTVQAQQIGAQRWGVGFGLHYPRYAEVNITRRSANYGAYASLQKNFSPHVALRMKATYSHLTGEWPVTSTTNSMETTDVLTGGLDLLYYLTPFNALSPYLYAGGGGIYRSLNNYYTQSLEKNAFGGQFNLGVGTEWKIRNDGRNTPWSIVAEFGHHQVTDSELDGAVLTGKIEDDSYWTVGLGLVFRFGERGAAEDDDRIVVMPGTSTASAADVDYNRIEEMIRRNIPKEVVREVVVDRIIYATATGDKLVLVGVNFAFDKSDLLPESYPVLDDAVRLLNKNKTMTVEIRGYADDVGTREYNNVLSLKRAETVKAYLIKKGISSTRLSTTGEGESDPVATNITVEGRELNRRIVFRIITK